jgi:hypothetical protein
MLIDCAQGLKFFIFLFGKNFDAHDYHVLQKLDVEFFRFMFVENFSLLTKLEIQKSFKSCFNQQCAIDCLHFVNFFSL